VKRIGLQEKMANSNYKI